MSAHPVDLPKLSAAARRVQLLADDPHPGLFSWKFAMHSAMAEVLTEAFGRDQAETMMNSLIADQARDARATGPDPDRARLARGLDEEQDIHRSF